MDPEILPVFGCADGLTGLFHGLRPGPGCAAQHGAGGGQALKARASLGAQTRGLGGAGVCVHRHCLGHGAQALYPPLARMAMNILENRFLNRVLLKALWAAVLPL